MNVHKWVLRSKIWPAPMLRSMCYLLCKLVPSGGASPPHTYRFLPLTTEADLVQG